MRSVRSGLLAFAVTGFVGAAVAIGCSASGDSSTDTSPTDPGPSATSEPAPPPAGTDPTPPPPPPHDAGHKDATVDAGPPPPSPGDPCTKPDSFATRPCGMCGTQQAICQAAPDAGADAGVYAWSDYGPCGNEMGVCKAGDMQACGNCGTQTCSKYCGWGSCTMPTGACKAGSTDYTSAGCTAPNTYRARTCSTTCSWGGYAATCAAPNNPNKMVIPTSTTAAPTSANWTFSATNVGDSLDLFGGCPGTARMGNYPFQIIEIQNPTAQKATVTIQSGGGTPDLDVVIWAYNKTLPPPDDTALGACDYPPTDSCPASSGITCPTVSGFWGGLKGVTINPGASVLVIISSYYATDAGFGTAVGTVNLQVKTTGLM